MILTARKQYAVRCTSSVLHWSREASSRVLNGSCGSGGGACRRSPAPRSSMWSMTSRSRRSPRSRQTDHGHLPRRPLETFYREGREPMDAEDLTEIQLAGRRCGVCLSARGWRRFELIRPAGREPVLLCGSCRARFGDDPPVNRTAAPASQPAPAATGSLSAPAKPRERERRSGPRPDRLRAALDTMPSSFSTAMVARAARLNNDKALARLQDLERRGEVRRVGNRWSTEPPPSEVAEAMDRLEARTSNLRIVRNRSRVH